MFQVCQDIMLIEIIANKLNVYSTKKSLFFILSHFIKNGPKVEQSKMKVQGKKKREITGAILNLSK